MNRSISKSKWTWIIWLILAVLVGICFSENKKLSNKGNIDLCKSFLIKTFIEKPRKANPKSGNKVVFAKSEKIQAEPKFSMFLNSVWLKLIIFVICVGIYVYKVISHIGISKRKRIIENQWISQIRNQSVINFKTDHDLSIIISMSLLIVVTILFTYLLYFQANVNKVKKYKIIFDSKLKNQKQKLCSKKVILKKVLLVNDKENLIKDVDRNLFDVFSKSVLNPTSGWYISSVDSAHSAGK